MLFKSVLLATLLVAYSGAQSKDWWETASFYQIYPRSFKDSNGDGVGDLMGITQHLSYLYDIGITATWLSPIFKSPMADFGYDISNFKEIDPIFGTMKDFEILVFYANKLGIKIILDFVPNHTSDECEWFKKSVLRDPFYKDFYVWAPGRLVNGVRQPPSNWVSVFRGSAWTWHPVRGEYYLHQFDKKQPDLNYRNPMVREAMQDVLRFWLDRGAAGFRIDAIQHLFEIGPNADGNYMDEPRNWDDSDPESYGYTRKIFTIDQFETTDIIYEWRAFMDDYQRKKGGDTRILMAESYSDVDVVMGYYGKGQIDGAHIPFNFLMLQWINHNSNAYHYSDAINAWLMRMPENRTANWVMGNHDKNRIGSRLGTDRIDMINMLLATLPGASVTYQGEELGMTDNFIPWEDTVDPQACNTNPDIFQSFSRDPARTPFQWSAGKNAGFSTANRTWLPVNPNHVKINVNTEYIDTESHLNIFRNLQILRKNRTFQYGQTEVKPLKQNVLVVCRSLRNDYTYYTLVNSWNNIEFVDLSDYFEIQSSKLEYALVNKRSQRTVGSSANAYSLVLMPHESVVLRSANKEF